MINANSFIGDFGRYQIWLIFLLVPSQCGVALHQYAIIFLAPQVHYTCNKNKTVCCNDPVYDRTAFSRTIVMEWDLICERSWLIDFSQTVFQFGVLAGSLFFGLASDRYGRRITLVFAVIMESFTGIMSAFMPEYWSFTIMRMLIGVSVGGATIVAFVLLVEYVGVSYRDYTSIAFHISFTIGHIALALFGFYIRDYVRFQLSISAVNLILLFYICSLPESPRWLLVKNKTFKAIEIMEHVAEMNNLPKLDIRRQIEAFQLDFLKIRGKKATVADLFLNPNLRKNILTMSFLFLVSGYNYSGACQYISGLTVNLFINVAASGALCLCGCLLTILLIRLMERRIFIITINVTTSFCFIIITMIPEGLGFVIMGCFGVMFCFITLILNYLYCSEIFPTVVRSAAIGLSSLMARLGFVLAPFAERSGNIGNSYVPILFGVLPLIAAGLCVRLPETKDIELPMIVED